MAYCDCCHEEWPADFICQRCSGEPELVTRRVPVVMWDYIGPDTEEVEDYAYFTVCGNCCTCPPTRKQEDADAQA